VGEETPSGRATEILGCAPAAVWPQWDDEAPSRRGTRGSTASLEQPDCARTESLFSAPEFVFRQQPLPLEHPAVGERLALLIWTGFSGQSWRARFRRLDRSAQPWPKTTARHQALTARRREPRSRLPHAPATRSPMPGPHTAMTGDAWAQPRGEKVRCELPFPDRPAPTHMLHGELACDSSGRTSPVSLIPGIALPPAAPGHVFHHAFPASRHRRRPGVRRTPRPLARSPTPARAYSV